MTNASVLNTLADADVRFGSADPIPGLFTDPSIRTALGIGTVDSSPSVRVNSGAVPDSPVDQAVDVDGTLYTILSAEPDGMGMTKLMLERMQ
jgi:hypothetical protein